MLEQEALALKVESAKVINFEDFDPDQFCKHSFVIVCVATHYEGDPCDNSKKVRKWINAKLKSNESDILKGQRFCVFGLGDTSYEQYNNIGKTFNSSMETFGGERISKYGEGNAEGTHTEDDFNEWKKQLWVEVIEYYK